LLSPARPEPHIASTTLYLYIVTSDLGPGVGANGTVAICSFGTVAAHVMHAHSISPLTEAHLEHHHGVPRLFITCSKCWKSEASILLIDVRPVGQPCTSQLVLPVKESGRSITPALDVLLVTYLYLEPFSCFRAMEMSLAGRYRPNSLQDADEQA
jgi:hypothetical protein